MTWWQGLSMGTQAVLRDAAQQLAMVELENPLTLAARREVLSSSAYVMCPHLRYEGQRKRDQRRAA